jgi:hypothetical protein
MTNKTLRRVLASAWIFLAFTALAACASGAPATSGAPAGSTSPRYTGYNWQVVAVSHDGKVTPIPARYPVTMQFSPGGQFVASDGVHGYSGTYRAASDAFTTSVMARTANGYIGNDPILLLTIGAMDSFARPAAYSVGLTGDRLVVDVGSYTLTCHRAGRPADAPAPVRTG